MLQIWKQHQHGGIATRKDLLNDLDRNQQANSCTPLIVALRRTGAEGGTTT